MWRAQPGEGQGLKENPGGLEPGCRVYRYLCKASPGSGAPMTPETSKEKDRCLYSSVST